jgi:hypothetical protein
VGDTRNVNWEPQDPRTFHLEPGLGVYVPPHAPHSVKNGPQVSVSLSVTFQTPSNQRVLPLHAFNSRLRRLGMSPTPPGRRPAVDRGKDACFRT